MRVVGHSNIVDNKEAERLAHEGFGITMLRPELAFCIKPSTVKFTLKGKIANVQAIK